MKVLIHDYTKEEWEKAAPAYRGWEVIADDGNMKPCMGCFGCWIKNPGECVIKDGYEKMGAMLHLAEEVLVISRYTYGCFSSFIKNIMDRSISGVLPFFEIIDGEMHHKRRYTEKMPMRFIFRGSGLTDADKEKAKIYVEAVCRNFHATVLGISFEECDPVNGEKATAAISDGNGKDVLLINCSMRGNNANTKHFLDYMAQSIDAETESINLATYIKKEDELAGMIASADRIVLGMPLYVDGVPSQALRIMEMAERCQFIRGKKIYVVANMGFYESTQIRNLLGQVRSWCEACGSAYCGGTAIGAGEMMGKVMNMSSTKGGPGMNMMIALEKLGGAVSAGNSIDDIYADAHRFPRSLYMMAANAGWPADAKKNGLKKKDLMQKRKLEGTE